jgi:hypothetical protein
MAEPSLPDKIAAIHRRLAEARIPHAFGGALALAYYTTPRATIDVDVNVFLPPSRHEDVHAVLAPLGVGDHDRPPPVDRDGQCRTEWGRNPVDLFFAYDELHEAMRGATRVMDFGDERLPVLAPEHLIVCKAVFNRRKDWIDIEHMLVSVEDLDVEEIDRWLGRILGEDDPRRERFHRLRAA